MHRWIGDISLSEERHAERQEFVNHLRSDLKCTERESVRSGIARLKRRIPDTQRRWALADAFIEYVETRHAVMFQDSEKPGLLELIQQVIGD